MNASPRPALNALTGLRFFAAAHVVVYHFGRQALASSPDWARNLLYAGDASVSLFFVLSGFVLTYAYAGRGELDRRAFWGARFARLYPMYLFSLLLATPFVIGELRQLPLQPALTRAAAWGVPVFSMTQAWIWQTANKWNFPAWSLSAEAFFYLVFPAVMPRLASIRGRRMLLVITGLWAILLVSPIGYLALNPDHVAPGPAVTDGPWLSTIAYNPLLHLPEFLMGMLVGFSFLRANQARSRPRVMAGLGLAAVGGTLALACVSAWFPVPLFHNGFLAPAFAVLVYALAMGGGPLAWLLSRRPVVLLGEASYALYLLQVPVWDWLSAIRERVAPDWLPGPDSAAYFSFYCVVAVACALLAVRFVERPARARLRHLLTNASATASHAARAAIRPA